MMRLTLAIAPLLLAPWLAGAARGDPADAERNQQRIDQLERTVAVLAAELERLRTAGAVPEQKELRPQHGLGPAASKFYGSEPGLSLGGYGEWRGRFRVDDANGGSDVVDALRAVFYAGYKFDDHLIVNTEIEFEHAGDSVEVEFFQLDYLLDAAVNLRAGLLLIPMGFVNEIHEPPFFFGAERPEVERRMLPSTWRENGVGVFGRLLDRIDYRVYVVNGFRASGFRSDGVRGGRQNGIKALANHFAVVARADVDLVEGISVGGSFWVGKSGQNERLDSGLRAPDAATLIWEAHAELRSAGWSLRGLFSQVHIRDAAELSLALGLPLDDGVARRMGGGYAEIGYDILAALAPGSDWTAELFYRFEHVDTQRDAATGFSRNREFDRNFNVVGISLKPHPQVVFKLDYRNISSAGPGGIADEVQAGFGFVF